MCHQKIQRENILNFPGDSGKTHTIEEIIFCQEGSPFGRYYQVERYMLFNVIKNPPVNMPVLVCFVTLVYLVTISHIPRIFDIKGISDNLVG